jgi:circadian clock protein KaiC
VRIERLSTGSAALDEILGGGLPAYSLNVVAGGPGTGKCVLTLQTLFHQARQGKRAVYFTTLSEPAIKFFRYMQQFDFFDQSLVDDRVFFLDLGSQARSRGLESALDTCIQQLEEKAPDLVAIDSFRAFHDLVQEPERIRAFAYDLAVGLVASRATAFLVGEYYPEEVGRYPEFTMADGIFHLLLATQNYRATREIEVLKLRGSTYASGRHFFDITPGGLVVYPRVSVPKGLEDGQVELMPERRLDVGVAGLDEMLGGGFRPIARR